VEIKKKKILRREKRVAQVRRIRRYGRGRER